MPKSKNRKRECQWCSKLYELGVDSTQHKYCSVECRKQWHADKWHSSKIPFERKKKYRIKHQYGITLEEYNSLLEKQNNKCSICLRESPTGYNWHIDHSHDSNKVRGILCSKCNQGLGLFEDNIESLHRAIEYLNENNKRG
jgi:hypothetical protein